MAELARSDVVGELVFKITNNSDTNVVLCPINDGTVQIGPEMIELCEFAWATFGHDLDGDLFPGVTKIGGVYFAIKGSAPAEFTEIVYRTDAPHDDDSYRAVGPDFAIVLDVSEHA